MTLPRHLPGAPHFNISLIPFGPSANKQEWRDRMTIVPLVLPMEVESISTGNEGCAEPKRKQTKLERFFCILHHSSHLHQHTFPRLPLVSPLASFLHSQIFRAKFFPRLATPSFIFSMSPTSSTSAWMTLPRIYLLGVPHIISISCIVFLIRFSK